jgi:hypothetical protein
MLMLDTQFARHIHVVILHLVTIIYSTSLEYLSSYKVKRLHMLKDVNVSPTSVIRMTCMLIPCAVEN